MDRREFTIQLWKRIVRPLIAVIVLFLCLRFLVPAVRENREILIIITLGVIALAAVLYLLGIVLRKLIEKINSALPNRVKFVLRVAGKTLEFLLLPALGIVLYRAWQEDKYWAALWVVILMFDRIGTIIKEEKSKKLDSGNHANA
jgi:hypothetical protein